MLQRQYLLPLTLITGAVAGPTQTSLHGSAPLRFTTAEGTFQITVFNDQHYGEATRHPNLMACLYCSWLTPMTAENLRWGPAQDMYSTKVMNAVLDAESPQLVVLNRDLITGALCGRDCTAARATEAGLGFYLWYPTSLTGYMVPGENAGVSNYFLEPGGTKYQTLDKDGNTVTIPENVDESVAEWFREINKFLTNYYRRTIPSLAFYHIPVQAMAAFQAEGVNANKEPGINDDYPLAQQGQVTAPDGSTYYDCADVPFMEALTATPGLMATFSGHDHGDDWSFTWNSKLPNMTVTGNGVDLCFGRHTGYGSYGNWMRGGRQVLLNLATLGKTTETWVRLEDGSGSGQVTLNSTYGRFISRSG